MLLTEWKCEKCLKPFKYEGDGVPNFCPYCRHVILTPVASVPAKEWCLHCETTKLIMQLVEKEGKENVDFSEVVSALIQVLCEIACSAEDPAEWGRHICQTIMVEVPEACKEEIAERKKESGVEETKH